MIGLETRRFGPFLIYRIRPPRDKRLANVIIGLVLFGFALGLSVEASLGVNPWTVFHGGLANHTPLTIGTATIATGLVLLVSFPVYQEPIGLGTLLNVAVIGTVTDLTLFAIPDLESMVARVLALIAAPILIGLASGLYIGAGLGPGPRDGIMTALERRNLPVWFARTLIEVTALSVGWLLGGNVGFGTLWMAGSVGFWVHVFLHRLRIDHAPAPVGERR
ncbi:MAG: YczE/YyaS/YitT family protein [Acidimicrobiales bacterium]